MTDQNHSQNQGDEKAGDSNTKLPIAKANNKIQFCALAAIALGELGIVCWMLSEHFGPMFPRLGDGMLLFGAIAVGAYGIHNVIKSEQFKKDYGRYMLKLWVGYGLYSIVLTVAFFAIRSPAEPKPHFILYLQTGDSAASTVFLTNECLFITNFDIPLAKNGSVAVSGCLIIPVQAGESNEVLNFFAENDSSVKANDFEISVALPKDWACLAHPKWQSADIFAKPARSSIIKNLQVWWIPVPWAVFPGEDVHFPPITNTCVVTYRDPKTKAGFMAIEIRSTDFTNFIAANIIFFPSSSNFFTVGQ